MIAAIQETTLRLLYHVRLEQKVEREQVAQVTGTNKDDSVRRNLYRRQKRRYIPMIHAPAEAERSINSAAAGKRSADLQG